MEKVFNQGAINIGGPVKVIDEDHYPSSYKGLYFTPAETRSIFKQNGWSTVAAFQTRNPMHRSHEYLAKIAIEICDGLLIHQVLGALKKGDIPAEIRVKCIDNMVKNYFVKGSAIQAGYPIEMRYGGPKEALLHALFRQNFGCSHLVVGRDGLCDPPRTENRFGFRSPQQPRGPGGDGRVRSDASCPYEEPPRLR